MYNLTRHNNLHNREQQGWNMGDVVDTMPYKSSWAPGGLAGCAECNGCDGLSGAGVSASVGVGSSGLNVNTGGNISFTWLLIAGAIGYFVFFKKGKL